MTLAGAVALLCSLGKWSLAAGVAALGATAVQQNKKPLPRYDPDGPHIAYTVVLPDAMRDALKAYDPDFKIWDQSYYPAKRLQRYPFSVQESPSTVIGDFNGDGRADAALAGRNRTGTSVIAILSSKSGYTVVPVRESKDIFDWIQSRGGKVPRMAFNIVHLARTGETVDVSGDMVERHHTLKADGLVVTGFNPYGRVTYAGQALHWWDSENKKFIRRDFLPSYP